MTSKSLARQREVVGRGRFAGVFLVPVGLYSTIHPTGRLSGKVAQVSRPGRAELKGDLAIHLG